MVKSQVGDIPASKENDDGAKSASSGILKKPEVATTYTQVLERLQAIDVQFPPPASAQEIESLREGAEKSSYHSQRAIYKKQLRQAEEDVRAREKREKIKERILKLATRFEPFTMPSGWRQGYLQEPSNLVRTLLEGLFFGITLFLAAAPLAISIFLHNYLNLFCYIPAAGIWYLILWGGFVPLDNLAQRLSGIPEQYYVLANPILLGKQTEIQRVTKECKGLVDCFYVAGPEDIFKKVDMTKDPAYIGVVRYARHDFMFRLVVW